MTGMSDDELRTRLARLDPTPAGATVHPVPSPWTGQLVERTVLTKRSTDESSAPRRRRPLRAPRAAVALVAVIGTVLALSGGGGGGGAGGGEDPTALALELPPSDDAGSCVRFDVAILAGMPVALAGTVTAIGAEHVTVDVDRWYRGGDADRVVVAIPDGRSSAALDGVDFREGDRYLITATDGIVNGCGFSGPAEPQLERAFDQAFGA